eukprot:6676186-Alexandrium_andersonii.AAC.1
MRLEEPQGSVDMGARGPDSPKQRSMLDTLALQQQETDRARTLDPIWLQEVPDGDGRCGPAAELEEASEAHVPDEARPAERLD